MSDAATKWPNCQQMGQIRDFFFQIRSTTFWLCNPGFVSFGANLSHFRAKPTIPGLDVSGNLVTDPDVQTGLPDSCYKTLTELVRIRNTQKEMAKRDDIESIINKDYK